MKKLFSILILLALLTAGTVSTTSEVAMPPLEKTGAPQESYCTDCHVGKEVNAGNGTMGLVFSGKGNRYFPDATYTITVSVSDPDKSSRGGFETTILDGNDQPAGTVTITQDDRTILRYSETLQRQYVTNFQGPPFLSWTYQWKAPDTNAGNITIYAATNASNDDFTRFFDHIYAKSLVLSPALISPKGLRINSGIGEESDFDVYPTLINRSFRVKYVLKEEASVQISLWNQSGLPEAILLDEQQDAGVIENTLNLDRKTQPGIYFLVMKAMDETSSQKVVIQ